MCAAVCVALAVSLGALESGMVTRAHGWDLQNRWMRSQAAGGSQVLPYERLPLSRMTEPFRHGGRAQWPASCIADYYRVRRITQASELPRPDRLTG
ncbi:putative integral membrane protein [Streptomyces formicae]|uniref:Putative integral membrane protein n=1 Tax=Streptomyces formicae TaxID=1616117 RepID=A0A291QJ45_9ACTN|nr:putative integral membrane protein [Streptomyces formicae]